MSLPSYRWVRHNAWGCVFLKYGPAHQTKDSSSSCYFAQVRQKLPRWQQWHQPSLAPVVSSMCSEATPGPDLFIQQPLLPVFDRHFVVGPRAGLWGAGTKQAGLLHSVPRSFFCPLCFSPPLLLPTRSGQYHPSLRLPWEPFKGSSHILCLASFQSITHTVAKVIFLFYIFNIILIISLQFNMHQCS